MGGRGVITNCYVTLFSVYYIFLVYFHFSWFLSVSCMTVHDSFYDFSTCAGQR